MVQVKNKLASWYVQKFIISRSQIFDVPGFVLFKLSNKSNFYSRQIILPEDFFVNLEKEIVSGLGEKGKSLLYSLGKQFGYRFATVSGVKSFENINSIAFKEYVYLVTRFVEGTYSSRITHKIVPENKQVSFSLSDFIICSRSGEGYFLSAGGIAGIWAKLLGDVSLEAIHFQCQGKGADVCKVVAAPKETLIQFGKEIFSETDLEGLDFAKEYPELNSQKPLENSTKTFQFFLDSNIFNYKEGVVLKGDNRFFIIESSIIHLIEKVFSSNQLAKDIFSKVAFKTGQELVGDKGDSQYLTDLLSAFGFGDVFITKKNNSFLVNIDFVPWSRFCEGLQQIFLNNFLSGALSKISSKEIKLACIFSGFNGKGFTLSFS